MVAVAWELKKVKPLSRRQTFLQRVLGVGWAGGHGRFQRMHWGARPAIFLLFLLLTRTTSAIRRYPFVIGSIQKISGRDIHFQELFRSVE
jgi:hypothetical protein